MSVASLHGELTKQQRQTTLAAFRRGAWAGWVKGAGSRQCRGWAASAGRSTWAVGPASRSTASPAHPPRLILWTQKAAK